MRLSSHDPALVAVNVNAGLAVAVLLIARMIDVSVRASWTCPMDCWWSACAASPELRSLLAILASGVAPAW